MSRAETCLFCGAIIPEGLQVCLICQNKYERAPVEEQKGKVMNINSLVKEIHENAVAHGWWDEERSFGEIVALCHSELSEALEEYRNGKPLVYGTCALRPQDCEHYKICDAVNLGGDKFCGEKCKPEGGAVELIDCVIRIFDYLGKIGVDTEKLMLAKHEYNKTRPYRHGGKVI